MKPIAVFTTVDNQEKARAIARAVVERKLAACAQLSQIESFYTWKGAVQNEGEYRILFKTTDERYGALETALREMHPYELPAIYSVPMDRVFPAFAEWMAENSGGS